MDVLVKIEALLKVFPSKMADSGLEVYGSSRNEIQLVAGSGESKNDIILVPAIKIDTYYQVEFIWQGQKVTTFCNCTLSKRKSLCQHGAAACYWIQWKYNMNKAVLDKLIQEAPPQTALEFLRYNVQQPEWRVSFTNKIDWFDVTVKLSWEEHEFGIEEIHKIVKNRQNRLELPDGTIGVLSNEVLEKYSMLFLLGETKKNAIRLSRFNAHVLENYKEDFEDPHVALKELNQLGVQFSKLPDENIPDDINAALRDYQVEGFQYLQKSNQLKWGVCLADEMGLGKTLQVIIFIAHLVKKNPAANILVACPKSIVYNWMEEIKKFFPALKYKVYYGKDRKISEKDLQDFNLFITSYHTLRIDIENLKKIRWNYFILDESHTIKNPASMITKSVMTIASDNRLTISGTPVQNNTTDAFSQYNFLNPGMLGSFSFFQDFFGRPIDEKGDQKKLEMLQKLLYPFTFRRTKEMVASELPEKMVTVKWCEMDEAQRNLYEKYKAYYRNSILQRLEGEGKGEAVTDFIFKALHELRQICDHPKLLKNAKEEVNESVKMQILMDDLEEISSTNKVVVFSQFVEMLDILKGELESRKMRFHYMHGGTEASDRQEMVKEFQEDTSVRIFLISIKTGGQGITLTAADYVYIYDPWWNPAVENQAIDRVHRIGQKSRVFAYKMICRDSVEEKILQLQERKAFLSSSLTRDDASIIKSISKEDIEFILE